MAAACGAVVAWVQMFPMTRVTALEKLLSAHIQDDLVAAQECENRDLKLRIHVLENYPTNALITSHFDKLESKIEALAVKIDNK